MRILMAMLLLVCGLSVAQTSTISQPGSYQSDAEQTVAILLADNGLAPIPGFFQTLVSHLGDDAAVGVIQYLGDRKTSAVTDSTSPQEIRRILLIIRMAFAAPNSQPVEGHRVVPKATLVLLKYLSCLPAAAAVKDDLESTSKFVEQIKLAAAMSAK